MLLSRDKIKYSFLILFVSFLSACNPSGTAIPPGAEVSSQNAAVPSSPTGVVAPDVDRTGGSHLYFFCPTESFSDKDSKYLVQGILEYNGKAATDKHVLVVKNEKRNNCWEASIGEGGKVDVSFEDLSNSIHAYFVAPSSYNPGVLPSYPFGVKKSCTDYSEDFLKPTSCILPNGDFNQVQMPPKEAPHIPSKENNVVKPLDQSQLNLKP